MIARPPTEQFRRVFLLLLASACCYAGKVDVAQTPGTDLHQFKTFQMLSTRVLTKKGILENDPDVSPFINSSVRKALGSKGLIEIPDGANLQVSAGAFATVTPQVEAALFDLGGMGASWGTSPIAIIGRYNKEGTVFVNLIDPRTKKSVWIGLASRALGRPSTMGREIERAIQAMFRKYPTIQ